MKPQQTLLCGLAALSLPFSLFAADASQLLDKAITAPGSYSQICDVPTIKRSPEVPLYGISQATEYEFSVDSMQKLRAERKDVVAELEKRLSAMTWDQKPKRREYATADNAENPDEIVITDTGLDTSLISSPMLKIIMDLNATECIPELLRLEADLSKRLEKNAEDPVANPLPDIQADIGGVIDGSKYQEYIFGDKEPTPEIQKAIEQEQRRVFTLVFQRELLSTVLVLLRQERYEPLLKSEIEAKFAESVKKAAAEEDLANFKKEADIPETDRNYLAWDEVTNAPYYPGWPSASLPYSPETRQKVIDMAKSFLSSVPVEKRLGAKGMLSRPMYR